MTSRRNFLTLVGAGAAASLLGCAPTARRDPPPTAIEDRLLVDTTGGLVLLHGEVIDALGPAATTADGQTIFTAQPVGADTELRILSARTGEVTRSVHLAGRWTPSTGGSFGDVVALLPPSYTSDTYPPAGRSGTSMMVVSGEQVHRLDLPGNYTPDAFARDAAGLFVLDWLPSTSPEHYRVREVQLAGGEVTALFGRDKVPIPPEREERMRGVRRNAVLGTHNDVLYTLYTHQPPSSTGSAEAAEGWDAGFIHTLHLDQRWAYCVDLPAPFGLDPNASHAIAADTDGTSVYVVDAAAGKLAVVGTESLSVQRVLDIPKGTGPAYAAFAADTLYVVTGTQVVGVAGRDLSSHVVDSLPGNALGLASSMDGQRVYVGLPDRVAWYDARSFARLGQTTVPALTGLRQVI